MATYEKGALGPYSGKVGSVIGSKWRSIDYLRSLPKKKHTNRKPSGKQLEQQMKFTIAVDFLAPWRSFINFIPNNKGKSGMTNFNAVSSILIKKIEGQYPNLTIPYHAVEFTRGQLLNILPTASSTSEELKITWPNILGFGASDRDLVVILIYNESDKAAYIFKSTLRGAGQQSLFTDEFGEGIMHIWTVVLSVDGTKWSDSKYCGMFEFKRNVSKNEDLLINTN